MIPNELDFGLFSIHLYGVILGMAMVVGGWVSLLMAEKITAENTKLKISASDVWDGLVWAVVFGVIGARLYHVVDLWSFYKENLILIPQVWRGGLGIFGAVFGGVLGLYLFSKRKGYSWKLLIDLASFGLPLGQAIGRLGNFVNQELYGLPTNLPWAMPIELQNRVEGYEQFGSFHPLFAYEAIWSLLSFIFLLGIYRIKRYEVGKGKYFVLYIVLYSLCRFFLERLRIDPWMVFGVPVAQIVSGLVIFIGVVILLRKREQR